MNASTASASESVSGSVEKTVKLTEFDAYLSAEVAAVKYDDGPREPMTLYQLKVRLSQRVDATITAGFELAGNSDQALIEADLRKAAQLFAELADELAAGALEQV